MPAKLTKFAQTGFSLIEIVIGMTTFAIALTIVTGVVASQINKTIDPVHQVRATELAQSLFNEILGKYYDENADRNGGKIRCNEDLINDADEVLCTTLASLGPDTGETTRPDFDDIDDYNGYGVTKDPGGSILFYNSIKNSLGQDISTSADGELYQFFGVSIDVFYDADQNGVADTTSGNTKLVRVTVKTPSNESLVFSSYKFNY